MKQERYTDGEKKREAGKEWGAIEKSARRARGGGDAMQRGKLERVVERRRRRRSEQERERKRAVSTRSNSFGVSLEEARQKEGDGEQNKSNQGIFRRRDVWPKSIRTPSLPHSAPHSADTPSGRSTHTRRARASLHLLPRKKATKCGPRLSIKEKQTHD